MVAQTTYEDTPVIGFNGMLAEQFSLRQVDSGLAQGALLLGVAVKPGTADGQYIPCIADDGVTGVVLYEGGTVENQSGDFTYADKAPFPVLSKGRYYAVANAAVAVGAVIAYDPATRKVGAVVGATTTLAFGKAITSAAADADLIIVEVDF